MKRLALSITLLALSFTAASPARADWADWAVIRFADGQCEIVPAIFWYGWPTIAVTPDWSSAKFQREWAIIRGTCIR